MMKNIFKKLSLKQSGFTLVEMLVYIAIFMVISVSSVSLLLSIDDFIDQYRLETMLYRSSTNTMEQVMLAIRQANQIDLINTIQDDPLNGRLVVLNEATTTSITFNGGELILEINSVDYGDVTLGGVVVDDFTVYHYDLAVGNLVRVRLSLTATLNDGSTKSMTFYGGGIIRGAV